MRISLEYFFVINGSIASGTKSWMKYISFADSEAVLLNSSLNTSMGVLNTVLTTPSKPSSGSLRLANLFDIIPSPNLEIYKTAQPK